MRLTLHTGCSWLLLPTATGLPPHSWPLLLPRYTRQVCPVEVRQAIFPVTIFVYGAQSMAISYSFTYMLCGVRSSQPAAGANRDMPSHLPAAGSQPTGRHHHWRCPLLLALPFGNP